MAKKKNAEAVTASEEAATPAAAPTPKQPSANGVTRPKDGTSTGRVWQIADGLSAAAGKPATRGDVMVAAKAEGLNEATIATQYGRWRKFHGLGRATAEAGAPADAPVAPAGAPIDAPVVDEPAEDEVDPDEDEDETDPDEDE
jgi:hypothetical protein